jgi:hypothetical protein
MGRKGICAICGRGDKLSFEHIPPQCTYNIRGVEMFSFGDWEDAGGDFDAMDGGHSQPEGTGFATLCERCNNVVTGSWYVPEFCKWVEAAVRTVKSTPDLEQHHNALDPWVRFELKQARPMPFVKQIAAMALALGGEFDPVYRTVHAPLVNFVLDKERRGVPSGYTVYVALFLGPTARFIYRAKKGSTGENQPPIEFTALDYPPFAYVLTMNESRPFLPCGNVTHFADLTYENRLMCRLT